MAVLINYVPLDTDTSEPFPSMCIRLGKYTECRSNTQLLTCMWHYTHYYSNLPQNIAKQKFNINIVNHL